MTERMRRRPLNRDVIKYIAILTMFLNHTANVFCVWGTPACEIMVDIGYFTAITMCYFLVEGYEYTRSKAGYAKRLLLFAVLSQIPFSLAFTKDGVIEFVSFNMLFTLLACFGIIYILKEMPVNMKTKLWIDGLILVTCLSDWGIMAPIFTIWFVQAGKDRSKLRQAWICSALLFGLISFLDGMKSFGIVQNFLHTAGCMIPVLLSGVCILYLYNGKRMEKARSFSKWFFYLFYPIHLLILGILRLILL